LTLTLCIDSVFRSLLRHPPTSPLFPYTTLFRSLNRIGRAPGEYPSGGPLPHLLEIWKAGAPSLDMLSPDIYFPNFVDLATRYKRSEEHTSELQSRSDLVCRLLLEKKNLII